MLVFSVLLGCSEDTESTWVQYNGDEDELTLEVGSDTRYVAAGDAAGDCAAVAGVSDDTTTTGGTDTGETTTGGTSSDTSDTGTSDEEVPEVAAVALTSSTGSVQIGWGCVSPSAGPVGTVHTVRVAVLDDYEEGVDRASVRTDSGDRGEDEYDLDRDSADVGYWMREIESVGEDGEQRTDTLVFRLWVEETSDTGG